MGFALCNRSCLRADALRVSPDRANSIFCPRTFQAAEERQSSIRAFPAEVGGAAWSLSFIAIAESFATRTASSSNRHSHHASSRFKHRTQPVRRLKSAARQTGQSSDGHDAQSLVARVRTAAEQGMGPLLNSSDGKATLVVVELRSDFMSYQALPVVASVEKAVDDLRKNTTCRSGLTIAESGSAVVGRDMGLAKQESAKQTSFWTVALVIILLVVVYRRRS